MFDDIIQFFAPDRGQVRGPALLDGPLAPNDELDHMECLVECPIDDLVIDKEGCLIFSSGYRILCLRPPYRSDEIEVLAEFVNRVDSIAAGEGGEVFACVANVGIVRVDRATTETLLTEVAGKPIRCGTAIAIRGKWLYLTEGSDKYSAEDWVLDFVEQNRIGRLIKFNLDTGEAFVLATNLAFPAGVSLSRDGESVVVSEAWAHRLSRFTVKNGANGGIVLGNLPGYPGRIRSSSHGYWLSVFALRTRIIEFVLKEKKFLHEMVTTVDPKYWVRPALAGLGSGLEPLQAGQMKKLGQTKPWAPPRSYGLLVLIGADWSPIASLHSRVSGNCHGVTVGVEHENSLFVVASGAGKILRMDGDPYMGGPYAR